LLAGRLPACGVNAPRRNRPHRLGAGFREFNASVNGYG
jgi:hypothetical protein